MYYLQINDKSSQVSQSVKNGAWLITDAKGLNYKPGMHVIYPKDRAPKTQVGDVFGYVKLCEYNK